VVLACLCWGLDNKPDAQNLRRRRSLHRVYKGLIAGSTNTILAVSLGARFPDAPALATTVVLGFVGYGMSLVLFILSLRHLGTARASAYFSAAPFVGSALAVILYGEPATGSLYLAAGLMAAGIWLQLTERHEHAHLHETLIHTHSHQHDMHHQHSHHEAGDTTQPHTHEHSHPPMRHTHAHFPDIHHQHSHS
jgi:drug/metabolite transporter (DMT)-like permease